MTKKLLFVHGTGVREDDYRKSLLVIQKQLSKQPPYLEIENCIWGESVGATLRSGGLSIPTYGQTRGPDTSSEEIGLATWRLLIQDPTFELKLLAYKTAESDRAARPPGGGAGEELLDLFSALRQSSSLAAAMDLYGLSPFWPNVVDEIEQSDGFADVRSSPKAGGSSHRLALARATVAMLQRACLESGSPTLTSDDCNALVRSILILLGGPDHEDRGVVTTLAAPFLGLAGRIATSQVRRRRTAVTDVAFPIAGDILLYQSNGEEFRQFIQKEIVRYANDEVYVFAHSLGGVAAFELLVQMPQPNVRGLITFGSQAPFFYELGALRTLPYDKPLPNHFPKWLNFYDLNDPLSYVGEGLFNGQVKDVQLESGESFPASHSAYLNNAQLWSEVKSFVNNA